MSTLSRNRNKPSWTLERPAARNPNQDSFQSPQKTTQSNEVFDKHWVYNASDERLPKWSGSLQNAQNNDYISHSNNLSAYQKR